MKYELWTLRDALANHLEKPMIMIAEKQEESKDYQVVSSAYA
jgi:hypothetical protein